MSDLITVTELEVGIASGGDHVRLLCNILYVKSPAPSRIKSARVINNYDKGAVNEKYMNIGRVEGRPCHHGGSLTGFHPLAPPSLNLPV